MIRLLLFFLIIYVGTKILVLLINWLRQIFTSDSNIFTNKKVSKKNYKNIEDADFEDISDKK